MWFCMQNLVCMYTCIYGAFIHCLLRVDYRIRIHMRCTDMLVIIFSSAFSSVLFIKFDFKWHIGFVRIYSDNPWVLYCTTVFSCEIKSLSPIACNDSIFWSFWFRKRWIWISNANVGLCFINLLIFYLFVFVLIPRILKFETVALI